MNPGPGKRKAPPQRCPPYPRRARVNVHTPEVEHASPLGERDTDEDGKVYVELSESSSVGGAVPVSPLLPPPGGSNPGGS